MARKAMLSVFDYTASHLKGWQLEAHQRAVRVPHGFEIPTVEGIKAWNAYAKLHYDRYNSEIGADGVLGSAWEQWGRALHGLLNGETGRLDCGTLSAIINRNLAAQGFGEE